MRTRAWFGLYSAGCIAMSAAVCNAHAQAPAVRDSAGIRIIENRAPAWSAAQRWSIAARPTVDIGATTGDSAYLLHRVVDSRRLRDGRIAVANSGSAQVRIFSSAGRHVSTIGRRGQAPGEFRSPWWIHELPGDSLLVLDIGRGFRFSVFDRTGTYRRGFTTPVSTGAEGTEVIGHFSDGTLFVLRHERGEPSTPGSIGSRRTYASFFRIGLDGRMIDSIGRFANQTASAVGFIVWSHWGWQAADRTTFYYGSSDRFEIEHRAMDGKLLRIIRLARPNRPVTAADIATWKAQALESEDARRIPNFAQSLERYRFAETFPAHFYLETDPAGNLWVQEYASDIGEGRRWTVFNPDGHYLGDIDMPERFRVHEIGTDYVLGQWRDEDEVEHVRLYPLIKPRP